MFPEFICVLQHHLWAHNHFWTVHNKKKHTVPVGKFETIWQWCEKSKKRLVIWERSIIWSEQKTRTCELMETVQDSMPNHGIT